MVLCGGYKRSINLDTKSFLDQYLDNRNEFME